VGIWEERRNIALTLFRSIQNEFGCLASTIKLQPIPEIDVQLEFEVQDELILPVVATLQGDELCLGVGKTFWCEWFPCSDTRVVNEFRSNLAGVLSGGVRLVEFSRGGSIYMAQLQECSPGYWKTAATWSKLRWPSFVTPSIQVIRNRPSSLRSAVQLDRALLADLRDNIADSQVFILALDAMRKEAKPSDLPLLLSLLKDKSPLVREAAAWPIAEIEGLNALRDLLLAFQGGVDDGCDQDGFAALLIDLVSTNASDAIPRLQALLRDREPAVKENARWLLDHCEANSQQTN